MDDCVIVDVYTMQYNKQQYIGLYCFSFFSLGTFYGILGPNIPYLARAKGIPQTEYFFIFIARTIGAFGSIISYKTLERYNFLPKQHTTLSAACFIIFLGHFLFPQWDTFFGEGFCIVLISLAYSFITTVINICLIHVAQQKSGQIIPFVHAIFGIGALLGPLILRTFEEKTFTITSLFYLVLVVGYYIFPSPQTQHKMSKQASQMGEVSTKLQIMFCFGLFFLVGMEVTYCGWISSYAVKQSGQTPKQAAIYVTYFWIASTICRLFIASSATVPSVKLKVLTIVGLFTGVFSIFLNWIEAHSILCLLSSILFGASTSGVFPLIIAIPTQFRLKLRPNQTSSLVAAASLSAGLITGLTGTLMSGNVNRLFYSLSLISICLFVCCRIFLRELQRGQVGGEEVELQEKFNAKT